MDINDLIFDYPMLYHVTARGRWRSVLEHGLHSTSALVDECKLTNREAICGQRRDRSERVSAPNSTLDAVIRDQHPLIVDKLEKYLDFQGNLITLDQWFERQSERVFFFLSESAAGRMADKYEKRGCAQDMIVLSTKSLVKAHQDEIELSPYNSGFNRTDRKNPSAYPCWYKLYHEIFLPIHDYPYEIWCERRKGSETDPVVELTVRGSILDIRSHVIRVAEMNGKKEGRMIYPIRVIDESESNSGNQSRERIRTTQKSNRHKAQYNSHKSGKRKSSRMKPSVHDRIQDFIKPSDDAISKNAVHGVNLLRENYSEDDDIIVFAFSKNFFVHAILVPKRNVRKPNHKDLLKFDARPESCWSEFVYYDHGEAHVGLGGPFDSTNCKALLGGEKLVFGRYFRGNTKNNLVLEISQKFFHSLNLYYVEDKNSYCTIDEEGDIKEIIYIHLDEYEDFSKKVQFVTVKRRYLDRYLALSDMSMLSSFEFRGSATDDISPSENVSRKKYRGKDIYYSICSVRNSYSIVKGHIIYRTDLTKSSLVQGDNRMTYYEENQYETFKIRDLKTGKLITAVSDPNCISDYFEDSKFPRYLSPAYFNGEVLQKYRNDPQKYQIRNGTITCRNSWFMQSYRINERDQVHVCIGDLAQLPPKEQKHWVLYNEEPKGELSRAYLQEEIIGNFSSEVDPLEELKEIVRRLNCEDPIWWSRRVDEYVDDVQFVTTGSMKMWGSEILSLNIMVVEGFQVSELRKIVSRINSEPNEVKRRGSIDMLEFIISTIEGDPVKARTLVSPLRELYYLRNIVFAHGDREERDKAVSKIKKDYGDTRSHFRDLVFRLRNPMKYIEDNLPR